MQLIKFGEFRCDKTAPSSPRFAGVSIRVMMISFNEGMDWYILFDYLFRDNNFVFLIFFVNKALIY